MAAAPDSWAPSPEPAARALLHAEIAPDPEHEPSPAAELMPRRELCKRLELEAARALRYERALAVLAVDLGAPLSCGHDAIAEALTAAVRSSDVVGWDGDTEALVILPETADTATVPAARILRALAPFSRAVRAGFARCPEDACDPATLLAGAREAARCAAPGDVATLEAAVQQLPLDERAAFVVDPRMKRLCAMLERLAASDLPILLEGETGAGKDVAAAALHAWSPRRRARMIAINCAALPETLLESELFGHERGAFSGAFTSTAGRFEDASGGTVLLDEIGECSLAAQAKLLRALETKRIARVGSSVERAIDVRIVAATNRSLEDEVAKGRFRQDLLFRLSAATVVVPSLRERPLDLPVLARAFLSSARARLARPDLALSPRASRALAEHAWPGNVRELKNVMDFVAATVDAGPVEPEHLPDRMAATRAWLPPPAAPPSGERRAPPSAATSRAFRNLYDEIRELERTRILEALEATGGVRMEAAALLGVPLRTFVTKVKEYAICVPPSRRSRRAP